MPLKEHEGRHLVTSSLILIKRAVTHFNLLPKHTRLLVGVSGGVDSLALLFLLREYNKRYNQQWEITACHIDPGFPGWRTDTLRQFFGELNITHHVVKKDIYEKIKDVTNRCYPCSRERRKTLLETASGLNIFHVALAHHKEDVAETVIMNMIYNGEISTLTPKQSVIHGRFFFVRPLYYFEKNTIRAIAETQGLPPNKNVCPYYQESKREVMRDFLERIHEHNPDVYKNIFRSIFHINKAYLP
ncbi:MAG: tRNA 2-thiocytidine biosynthesis protein TtcA [candidate division WOR-3 bacterium]|nr:MAG: tRNA 2-thiocytidine biosynthesis protein TtcA [candidate division WOR-3 bacterium]